MRRSAIGTLLFATALTMFVVPAHAGDVTIHGSASQGYIQTSDYWYPTQHTDEGTFSFNEAIVNFTTRVDARTRIGAQLLGRDLGRAGNNDIVLDWAFGDYRWRDYAGIRVGKVKMPLGLYNKTRDVDAVRTFVMLPQSVYTEEFRSVTTAFQGLSVYGDIAVGETSTVEYEVFGGNMEMAGSSFMQPVMMRYINGVPVLGYDVEAEYVFGGGLVWNTPLEGLRLGGTALKTDIGSTGSFAGITAAPWAVDMFIDVNSFYVLSAEYTWQDLILAAEFSRMDNDFGFTNMPFDPDGPAGPAPLMAVDVEARDTRGGWYTQAAYRFNEHFEFGAYYSVYHPDWSDRDGDALAVAHRAWQKDTAFTVRCDVTDNWVVKVEGHLISGTGQLNDDTDNLSGFGVEDWNMFSAKSTFHF